jgi:aspartyl aminopeptidase
VRVQTYGGGLWHTWFDRDLGVAGRLVLDTSLVDGSESKSSLESLVASSEPLLSGHQHLRSLNVRTDEPVMHIPSLAIHLDRSVDESFKFNKETHLVPILRLNESTAQSEG